MTENQTDKANISIDASGNPVMGSAFGAIDKLAPKFCTAIQVSLLNNKNLVLSLVYAEDHNNGTLIERVVIDIDHAKRLSEVLADAVERSKNEV